MRTALEVDRRESIIPTRSPRGSKIGFVPSRNGNQWISVMNADCSSVAELTRDPASDSVPANPPDGSRVAVHSNRDDVQMVSVENADGSNRGNITNYPGRPNDDPSWGR